MDAELTSASIYHFILNPMIEQNQPIDKEKLLEELGEGMGYLQALMSQELEYLKLDFTEKISLASASLITVIALMCVGFGGLSFLAIAVAVYLGNLLGSTAVGFLIMAGIFVILLVLIYSFRKTLITQFVVSTVIEIIFDDKDEDHEKTDQ